LSQKVLHSPHLPYKLVCYYLDPLSACAGNGDRPEKFDRWLLGRSLGSIIACMYNCTYAYLLITYDISLNITSVLKYKLLYNLYLHSNNGDSTPELYCIVLYRCMTYKSCKNKRVKGLSLRKKQSPLIV
jgi:hypothetical protein